MLWLFVILFSQCTLSGMPVLLAQEASSNPISIDLVDADISSAIRMLMNASGADIVLPGNLSKKITCQMHDKPLESILDALTKSAGLYYHKEDGTYIITEQPYSAPSPAPAVDTVNPATPVSSSVDL
ncbi:MAG TPA: STN domain-containing protein, partial [Armatimonadota bacterium]|nr:STN domain-containing protein [Armatimonadota bacterium]